MKNIPYVGFNPNVIDAYSFFHTAQGPINNQRKGVFPSLKNLQASFPKNELPYLQAFTCAPHAIYEATPEGIRISIPEKEMNKAQHVQLCNNDCLFSYVLNQGRTPQSVLSLYRHTFHVINQILGRNLLASYNVPKMIFGPEGLEIKILFSLPKQDYWEQIKINSLEQMSEYLEEQNADHLAFECSNSLPLFTIASHHCNVKHYYDLKNGKGIMVGRASIKPKDVQTRNKLAIDLLNLTFIHAKEIENALQSSKGN